MHLNTLSSAKINLSPFCKSDAREGVSAANQHTHTHRALRRGAPAPFLARFASDPSRGFRKRASLMTESNPMRFCGGLGNFQSGYRMIGQSLEKQENIIICRNSAHYALCRKF